MSILLKPLEHLPTSFDTFLVSDFVCFDLWDLILDSLLYMSPIIQTTLAYGSLLLNLMLRLLSKGEVTEDLSTLRYGLDWD